ncbi:MAG: PrsW family intramembrane metalloprotease [Bacteroidaceae bacterium]|nr:PrsW family intramembrane metalloprotease [Bacteroidaceae bacterium]
MIFIFLAAVLPAIVMWLYVWKRDRRKNPVSLLLKAVLWGVVVCAFVSGVEMTLGTFPTFDADASPTFLSVLPKAFFGNALPEELIKLAALWLVLTANPYYEENHDSIVYAACIALGFAFADNCVYFATHYTEESQWIPYAAARMLLAFPAHYFFAIIMGYYYRVCQSKNHKPYDFLLVLLLPFLAHGIYDALSISEVLNPYVVMAVSVVFFWLDTRFQHFMKKRLYSRHKQLKRSMYTGVEK